MMYTKVPEMVYAGCYRPVLTDPIMGTYPERTGGQTERFNPMKLTVKALNDEMNKYRESLNARLAFLESAGLGYASETYPALVTGTCTDETAQYLYDQFQRCNQATIEIAKIIDRCAHETKIAGIERASEIRRTA